MRLGTRARYSLRMMIELARLCDGANPVSLQEVSNWTGISRRYLEQLMVPLKNASLLRGRTGRTGGQSLARAPESISIREIVEAAVGSIAVAECVDAPAVCSRSSNCHCRQLWTLITLRIRNLLDGYSLADAVDPEWLKNELSVESKKAVELASKRATQSGCAARLRRADRRGGGEGSQSQRSASARSGSARQKGGKEER
ncbi:MAG: Rrf2 family transcriptional regulator [Pseudomonadota bacterium]